ncbi:MAG: MoaD/ThiS family protein, partial [Candidatus Nezhaarchaeales archaeon]
MRRIKVKFYGVLAKVIQSKEVRVKASTVRQLLNVLASKYGGLLKEEYYNGGAFKGSMNIYVNGEHVHPFNYGDKSLRDGDEVLIIPAVSGGSEVELVKVEGVKPAEYADVREILP